MSLFTKLFERDHHPYDLKGRWYKFTISSDRDAGHFSVVNSDIPVFDGNAPAFGYYTQENHLFVTNGYIIDHKFMTLSGSLASNNVYFVNGINPELGVMSFLTVDSPDASLFDLYLYIVKSNGTQNVSSGSDSDDHDIH